MTSKRWALLALWALSGTSLAAALGNQEISYWVNGKAYLITDGTLTDESAGKPLPASSQGNRARWYQGGTGAARPLLHLAAFQIQRETKVQEDYLFEPMGGSQATKAVLNGQLDWAVIGRELLPWEHDGGLVTTTIAWDGLFVVVPADLPRDSITVRSLAAIYVGSLTNWKELNGPDLPIVPFAYSERSGTAGAFRDLVLEKVFGDDGKLATKTVLLDYDAEVYDKVGAQPGGIGFGPNSLDGVEPSVPIKVLRVDSIDNVPGEVAAGRYPLARPLNFVTLGEPTGQARQVLDVLLGERVQGALTGLKLVGVE